MFRILFCFAIGICLCNISAFIELSTAHLLKKKARFYHLSVQRYSQNRLCCKHFETPGISRCLIVWLYHRHFSMKSKMLFTKMISGKSSTKSDKKITFPPTNLSQITTLMQSWYYLIFQILSNISPLFFTLIFLPLCVIINWHII
jgi:hypothetical protein